MKQTSGRARLPKSKISTVNVDPNMRTAPRAPHYENGGINLLCEFVEQLHPDFGGIDKAACERLIEEVREAFMRYLNHETKTLDLAFNVCRVRGYRREAAQKKFQKRQPLQVDGHILRLAGHPAGDAMYEVLAEMHGVDTRLAGEWYAEFNTGLKPLPPAKRLPLPTRFKAYISPDIAKSLVFQEKCP